MKNSHSNDLEEFKKNHLKKIEDVAKSKTLSEMEAFAIFKIVSQKSRTENSRIYKKENNELNEFIKAKYTK